MVDISTFASYAVISNHQIPLGGMTLCTQAQIDRFLQDLPETVLTAGGSGANTAVGLSALGVNTNYIGRIGDDTWGKIFHQDLEKYGVHSFIHPTQNGIGTGQCIIWITPNGQRTLTIYLGEAYNLGPNDINDNALISAEILYIEGYLWDSPHSTQAIEKAADLAAQNHHTICLSLSDSAFVKRHHEKLTTFIRKFQPILLGNTSEIIALTETHSGEAARETIRPLTQLVIATDSANGAYLIDKAHIEHIHAEEVDAIDSTGAGDYFAAGFLAGLACNLCWQDCLKLANKYAGFVIQNVSARPRQEDFHSMKQYLEKLCS